MIIQGGHRVKKVFKRLKAALLALCLVFTSFTGVSASNPSSVSGDGSFCLTVCADDEAVIEPSSISYTEGQTIKQALLASGIQFGGLEDGFIYSVQGVGANYTLFYDNGGYSLDAPASDITALCITDKIDCYSPELLALTIRMLEYRLMTNNVGNYAPAQSAYRAALSGVCEGAAAETCVQLLSNLNSAISDYEAMLVGDKYTVSFSAKGQGQNGETIEGFSLKLTDAYGNVTISDTPEIQVIPGSYDFVVSLGFNRTEGNITVEDDMNVSVNLPSDEWYGFVKVLDDGIFVPFEQNSADHTVVYYIDDITSTLALNPVADMGIPNPKTTYLYKIYTSVTGESVNSRVSWGSSTNSLSGLLSAGMEGATATLEARYTGNDGFVMIQSYYLSFVRVPTLSSLKVKDANGANLFTGFAPKTTGYSFSLPSGPYTIEAAPFVNEGCSISVNGGENGSVVDIAEGENTVTVTVQHTNGQSRTYTLNISGTQPAYVNFEASSGTTYQIFTMEGTLLSPGAGGSYALAPGAQYYYVSTKDTYFHTTQYFSASDGLTVQIAEPDTAHALQDFRFYDNSSAAIREEYVPDTEFINTTHNYIYSVPVVAESLYAQATATGGYDVRAEYSSQLYYDGRLISTAINYPVDDQRAATQLKSSLMISGYALEVTVILSRTENDVTYTQEYLMTLGRVGSLASLSLSNRESNLLLYKADGSSPEEFDRDITSYSIKVQRNEEEVTLVACMPGLSNSGGNPLLKGDFTFELNDEITDDLYSGEEISVVIPLDPSKESEVISVTVGHKDPYSVPTVYTVNVQKLDPVAVTFNTTPSDAIVFVINNITGKPIYRKDGVFYMTPGEEHTYTVTRNGYVGITQTFIAPQEDSIVSVSLAEAMENNTLKDLDADWPSFRADENNNGVVDVKSPITAENAFLSWATKLGEGFSNSATGCPILVDGYLYTYSDKSIWKVDTISGEVVAQGEMDRPSSFAINTPTYAEGMIFVGITGGVQAFNAETLESLWIYNDPLNGQPNCPIVYYDGYIYTGFWVGESKDGCYVCLSITDEDPSALMEEKLATWRYVRKGGFYWAGAYVCKDFLLVGTDDGENGYTKGYASVLSLDPKFGTVLDELCLKDFGEKWHFGDIRCSITYDPGTDRYYFNTKGWFFYGISVNGDGTIDRDTVRYVKCDNYNELLTSPPMRTCSPCIYNGRAYIGVSGPGQFDQYGGHNITVIDLAKMKIAYKVQTHGYPQTSGLLTTAYDEGDGTVYVYFIDNMTPGKLRIISDKPGQIEPKEVTVETYTNAGETHYYDVAPALFTPSGAQAQYAICSPIADKYGNIYFKNDSAYLMCLSNTITQLKVTVAPDKTDYAVGECFDPTGMKITACYTNGTERDVTDYVSYSAEPLSADDTEFEIRFEYAMYQDKDGETGVHETGVPYDAPAVVLHLNVHDENYVMDGDLNGDWEVNRQDVALLVDHVRGITPLSEDILEAADLNKDTFINENDVTLLIQLVLNH